MAASSVTMERVVDKVREIDARVRALERLADTDRALDDIRSSISLLADSMATGSRGQETATARQPAARPPRSREPREDASEPDVTALSDPRFRTI